MNVGEVKWSSPSNIAIVKYWGKHGVQLPRNPSVSFTLSESKSVTHLLYQPSPAGQTSVKFYFDGKENQKFGVKTEQFFKKLSDELPWINSLQFEIHSQNTFPHSSGIASSASGMSALVMCLLDVGNKLEFYQKTGHDKLVDASRFSRLGSGSACRSVFPVMAVWGQHSSFEGSSDLFGIDISGEIHEVFKTYHNDILIISRQEKSVSSSAGHSLMNSNPYAPVRYRQAYDNLTHLKEILKAGEIHKFGEIAEQEALVLHALMMASDPSYILLEPGSIEVVKRIRQFRAETQLPVYFTIDAGPNIHVLYPDSVKKEISDFIHQELKSLCANGMIIQDRVGNGPEKIL
jgi:diphosphomevalonate decarboxylase